MSDISLVRHEELVHRRPFEYPALARAVYLAERSVSGSLFGIAIVNLVAMLLVAAAVGWVLREAGADSALWVGAPILVLAGQNWDVLTALSIALALRAWLRGDDWWAGVWVGLGAAFKIVPAVLLVPMCAAGGARRSARAALAATVVVLAVNLPLVLRNATAWWYPYRFANRRSDTKGTIWEVLPLHGHVLGTASAVLLLVLLGLIAIAAVRDRLPIAHASALAILAFIVANKVWQPHYVIWLLPAAAFAFRDRRWVRALEWSSLAWYWVLWRTSNPSHPIGALAWSVGSLRLACLVACAAAIVVDGRRVASCGAAAAARFAGPPGLARPV
jgi:uncharacterized membrane protein